MSERDKATGSDLSPFEPIELSSIVPVADISVESVLERAKEVLEPIPESEPKTRRPWHKKELRELHRKPRKKKPRKRGRKKLKYWVRKQKERERNAANYLTRDKWVMMAMDNYERFKYNCSSKGLTLELTREDMERMIPDLYDREGIIFKKYDTRCKIVGKYRGDFYVREGKKRILVYSGSEQELKDRGYIL